MSYRVPALMLLALLAACTDNRFAADVTRFHIAPQAARGSVFLEPVEKTPPTLEYQNYAAAVASELREVGFSIAETRASAELVGMVSYEQTTRAEAAKNSPISIGIGGGTFGGNVGIGVGTTFGVGKSRNGEVRMNTLALQLKRASDGTVVWEGRASAEAADNSRYGPLASSIPMLADALLRDFPGTSGQTIRYKAQKQAKIG